jgi:hypothetical protein
VLYPRVNVVSGLNDPFVESDTKARGAESLSDLPYPCFVFAVVTEKNVPKKYVWHGWRL